LLLVLLILLSLLLLFLLTVGLGLLHILITCSAQPPMMNH
jgi:hypothetical protein